MLTRSLTEEQAAEEEAMVAADAALAHLLASEEAAEAGAEGPEDLVRLQRDAMMVFHSNVASSSLAGAAYLPRPRVRSGRNRRGVHTPLL